jgi:flagellar motor switch protein FliM
MAKPLDISHFRSPPRPALSTLSGITALASRIADALVLGLSDIRAAPWRVAQDGISQDIAPPAEGEGTLLRFESEYGSLTAFLWLDRQATSALLEDTMGGTGAEPAFEMQERPLSKIERGVMKIAYRALARKVAEALGDSMARPFSVFEGGEVPPIDHVEGLAHFRYVANIFTYSGEIRVTFSRTELESQLDTAAPDQAESIVSASGQLIQDEVGKSELTLIVTLGTEMLSIDAISGMQPGKHIELSTTATTSVTVWSGGIAAYQATLGRSGDRYAVTITSAIS